MGEDMPETEAVDVEQPCGGAAVSVDHVVKKKKKKTRARSYDWRVIKKNTRRARRHRAPAAAGVGSLATAPLAMSRLLTFILSPFG